MELPASLGPLLAVRGRVAFFEGGELRGTVLDPMAPPRPVEAGGCIWECGQVLFGVLLQSAGTGTSPAGATSDAGAPLDGPISTWRGVAQAVGVDDSTIREHRRRTKDRTRPIFADGDAARAWYAALLAKPDFTPSRARRPPKKKGTGEVVDWSKVEV